MAYFRVIEWEQFNKAVNEHVRTYTRKQYENPEGNEQIESFTPQDCIEHIKRYANRFGRNARGPTEELRDLLKIAHWAQIAWTKLKKEQFASYASENVTK